MLLGSDVFLNRFFWHFEARRTCAKTPNLTMDSAKRRLHERVKRETSGEGCRARPARAQVTCLSAGGNINRGASVFADWANSRWQRSQRVIAGPSS